MVIPANDHRIVVRLFLTLIAVGIKSFTIISGIPLGFCHIGVQRTLDSSCQINRPFDGLIVLPGQNLDFLHMFAGRKTIGRNAVSIRILFFQHRSLPCQQIGHGHTIFSSRILRK